ncbi:MAG: hypothetical protein P1P93_10310 [Gammaproteobacteria bacterium]|nr:hypothetical protein [Gammaproteobacteria bacterium]MDT8372001.1 hypothetical protein [Gammaproteobacteria bacterium]
MKRNYTQEQLIHIREQAVIYQCACPAQVCLAIDAMDKLYKYQQHCLNSDETNHKVHTTIAKSSEACYHELEQCLTEVLALEGWNMDTLDMPEILHKQLLDSLSKP